MSYNRFFRPPIRLLWAYMVVVVLMLAILVGMRFGHLSPVLGDGALVDSVLVRDKDADRADTLYINMANATELHRFGLSYFATGRVLMFLEAGRQFRTIEYLQHFSGIDSAFVTQKYEAGLLRFEVDSSRVKTRYVIREKKQYYSKDYIADHHLVADTVRVRRQRRVSLYHPTPQQLDSMGVDPSVRDSILEYRKRYVLKGSVREDSLVCATSHTIWSLVASHATSRTQHVNTVKPKPETRKLELNTATVLQLVELYNIGRYTANNIVAHRDSLGGYVDVRQLREVRGIDEDRYSSIVPQVTVDASLVKKIPINKVSVDKLKVHPYFSQPLAYAVCRAARKKPIVSAEDLKQRFSYHAFPSFVDSYFSFE